MKKQTMHYKQQHVDGINIFYRETGDRTKPHLILLNGVPSSSSAFQELMNDLKDDFYLVAPDFPGFGNSDIPSRQEYEYTFHNLSVTIEKFISQLGLVKPHLYAIGYGGPVGFRIAVRQPALFASLILQNSNAYFEGLGPAMQAAEPYLKNRNEETEQLVRPLLTTLDGIKLFYLSGAEDASRINPDGYNNSFYYLNRPGQQEIQLDLLYNYGSNLAEYPAWQQFLKTQQPRILLVWGKNDVFFPLSAAEAIKKDVPGAELHAFNTSHLALEEYHTEIAEKIRKFVNGR
ncbi:alpha/beta hydrolase [Chitinophaga agrisoli]|uniref:Alpha/beta hydrolase n=1 Tax=Chitinophaga agrisoli TaxID=2607653 RepID=A0A5B2VXF1_9BACT|nr:alpha/beta hydrolase [Chitinophaga agrisoli]KAA2243280.1 alpha/beta hydrolase [Chitinophaga agrisoli]